jgi:hypothetical protein
MQARGGQNLILLMGQQWLPLSEPENDPQKAPKRGLWVTHRSGADRPNLSSERLITGEISSSWCVLVGQQSISEADGRTLAAGNL